MWIALPPSKKRLMNPDANIAAPLLAQGVSTGTTLKPPVARREPVEHVLHGDRRVDHYAWLRHKENPEVIDYLNAENAYTDAILKPTETFQEKLYQEMLGRILQTDLSVPYRLRGHLYFTRTEEGKQYTFHCRRRDAEGAAEELLLDLNLLAEGHAFLGLGSFDVSEDNHLLAYSIDNTGFQQYLLQVKNLRAGTTFPERFERATSVAWASDNRTLFYTVEDETTKRSHRLYRHVLGSTEPDPLLYEETDERFRIAVERTRSGAFLLLTVASHTASEVRFLRADQPTGEFRLVAPREDNHEYYADHHPSPLAAEHPGLTRNSNDGVFYIRTNSGGRTFPLRTAPVTDARQEFWREIIPHRPDVMLAAVEIFQTHLVLFEREAGLPYLRILALTPPPPTALPPSHPIELADPAYNASIGKNPEFGASHVRFQYESFVTPPSVFDYDVRTRDRILRNQHPVLPDYYASHYVRHR